MDTPIRDYGWDLRPKDRKITFRHLADMTSGYARPEPPGAAWAYNDFAIQLYQQTLFDRVFRADPSRSSATRQRLGPLRFQDGLEFTGKRRMRASVRDFARIAWFWANRGRWGDRSNAKRESHREALVAAAVSGSRKFFLGTDSAPHARHTKETSCGCAGVYTAHAAIELYAEAFEAAGALEKLDDFAGRYGPEFYGLPRNASKMTLERTRSGSRTSSCSAVTDSCRSGPARPCAGGSRSPYGNAGIVGSDRRKPLPGCRRATSSQISCAASSARRPSSAPCRIRSRSRTASAASSAPRSRPCSKPTRRRARRQGDHQHRDQLERHAFRREHARAARRPRRRRWRRS